MSETEYLGNDRFLHDIINTATVGKKKCRKDTCLDAGAQKYGSKHRDEFPHRSAAEMAAYMCMQDIKSGKMPEIRDNVLLAAGHMFVDSLPAQTKKRMQLLSLLTGMRE